MNSVATLNSEQRFMAQLFRASRPRRLRPFSQWAESEIRLPSGLHEGKRYSTDRLPFTKMLLEELGKWKNHVIVGPVQSGKSLHGFILPSLYFLFERQENVILGLPDLNMAGHKWDKDIRPVIQASRYKRFLPESGQGSKQGSKVTSITFGNGAELTFMGGGGGDGQRAGATTRILIVTETEKLDEVGAKSKEGQTKIDQLIARTQGFGDEGQSFFECTVTTEDGFIWDEYCNGTRSRLFHLCKACGEWVSPEKEHLIGWEDAENEIDAHENSRFCCPNENCGILYTDEDRRQMNQDVRLVHRGQSINSKGEIVGDPPRTNTLGFRWSGFQNGLVSQGFLGRKLWLAMQSDDADIKMRARDQQDWAIPSPDPNVEKVDLDIAVVRGSHPNFLKRCNGIPQGELPKDCKHITAGIDVSRRLLQWGVECQNGQTIHCPDYGFHQNPNLDLVADEIAIEDGLRELTSALLEKYPKLSRGLIDVGNWMEDLLKIIPTLPGNVGKPEDFWTWRPSHGLPKYIHPLKSEHDKTKIPKDGTRHWYQSKYQAKSRRLWVFNFNANFIKGRVHRGFLIKPFDDEGNPSPGSVTLFGTNPEIHTQFARQITAEEYRVEFKRGRGNDPKWFKKRRDNHMFDVAVLNNLARSIVKYELERNPPPPANPTQVAPASSFVRSKPGGFVRRRRS
ncbi:Phage terminase large subunit (GpA) [Thalassoglobus neptunius]|uniref:Phage terminase large subunit (GpA) n=1 Tax=Thalassoglobus neptunius TaxID=1938619 RepID=A0A5C5X4T1_9PLAN|nr:terminase gpA endonuclease subunit [Thalassoglobus neptunius]TWT57243.1 Phage terminase large subunit (GpA) [Thalassoglobus neptunius]